MKIRGAFGIFCFLIVLFAASATSSAQCVPASSVAGALDTCFDGDGRQTTNVSVNQDVANGIAVQADGKILVTGYINRETSTYVNSDIALVRYNTNGSLDTTFGGGDGIVTTDGGSSMRDEGETVVVQADGKILVSGLTQPNSQNYDMIIVRYNADGSLDTTFDGDGRAVFNRPINWETAFDIVVQPDGKIIAVGYTFLENYFALVVRFNANGSVDTSFGNNGMQLVNGLNLIQAAALQTDGKIIVAGGTSGGSPTKFGIGRLESNGAADMSFGTNGIAVFGTSNITDNAKAVLVEPNGKIVAGGYSYTTSTTVPPCGTLVRFSASGILENSFVNCNDQPGGMIIYAIARQADGKIISAGFSTAVPSRGFLVIRNNSDFTLDTTFNGNGVLRLRFSDAANQESNTAHAVALQDDGRIVAAGATSDDTPGTSQRFAVARIMPGFVGRRTPFDFDGDSKTDISIFRPSVSEWWYLKSSNGTTNAAQFGTSSDKPMPADYTGDGKTDIAVWRGSTGEWFILRSEDSSYYSYPFGLTGDVPQVGDFDVDGKTDTAVFRPSNATWFIQRSSDGGAIIQPFGISGDIPVAADYDSDGRTDLAIFRPSDGQWWLNRSSAGVVVFAFGTSSDKLVPGDYTGDGKADVALWRPSTGEWFVLRSEDQSYYSFPFGISGDVPAPGDFDGDGKFDATVFRPSNATWFVNRTTGGTLIQGFGVSSDFPLPNAFVP